MHYYLAQQEASQREPGSTALLLNQDGTVSETPTANLLAYFEGQGLVSPQAARILPGVSLHFLAEMAKRLGVPFVDRALTPQDLRQADELFVTSTPYCMLPVASLNGESFPAPGPTYAKLLAAWSAEVQIDIVQQAIRCGRTRPSSS
jgi:branched-subunit amino acid aminotransferase/4-amino-4-deoxychorismate lyase